MAARSFAPAVGFWAACSATLLSLFYDIAQAFEWAGSLGSDGGPSSTSTPLGILLLLTPSLLLGTAFVVTIAALDQVAPAARQVFTRCAFAFAIVYATLTGYVYFIQLTFVGPMLSAGQGADIALLLFVPYKSFLFATDLLGYSFMSLATLFAAFGLPTSPYSSPAKIALAANGLLLPFLAFQMNVPGLIAVAALWAVTFPASTILLARIFRSLERS